MTGVAVKVTSVPAQTGFADGLIVTLTGMNAFTVIVTTAEVAGLFVVQLREEFITTYTWSLFAGI